MQQKIICMLFLIIGISVLSNSCRTRINSIKTITYVYRNSSGVDLSMEVYNSKDVLFRNYFISNNSSIKSHTSREFSVALFFFDNLEDQIGDSVVLRFTDSKCIHYSKNNSGKIFQVTEYDNYSPELLNEELFYLYYTITVDDYNESVDCE